jgi:lia operon protein LiaF
MSRKKQESLFWGLILLIVGLLFLLDNFGVDIDIWDILDDFWPMILIAIGLKNIWQHYNQKKSHEEK